MTTVTKVVSIRLGFELNHYTSKYFLLPSTPALGKLRPAGPIRPVRLFYPACGAKRAEGSFALPSAPSPAAVLTWQRSHKHSIHAFVPALRSSLRTHCGPRVKKFAHPWVRMSVCVLKGLGRPSLRPSSFVCTGLCL